MKRRKSTKRNLVAESLEGRQLLHGGPMAGGGEPPTTAERVEGIFERYDENDDMQLTSEEVSARLWNRISEADGDDENSSVSIEELTSHLDAIAAERAEQGDDDDGPRERNRRRQDRGGDRDRRGRQRGPQQRGPQQQGPQRRERATIEERIDRLFARHDENDDSLIAQDEVSERLWNRIGGADTGTDGVSADELIAQIEAQRQARVDAAFDRLDDNDDGSVTADEVSERRWQRISQADANGDGNVTAQELMDHLTQRRAEAEQERNAPEEPNDNNGPGPDRGPNGGGGPGGQPGPQ